MLLIRVAIVVALFACGFVCAYAGNMQACTLFIGIWTADHAGVPPHMAPTGFQDAITPPYQPHLNNTIWVIPISIIGLFYLFGLGVAIDATLASVIGYMIGRRKSPRFLSHYALQIISALANREADFKKNGDYVRADAASEMRERVEMFLVETQEGMLEVPDISEVLKARRAFR